jgi:hypothetical protein
MLFIIFKRHINVKSTIVTTSRGYISLAFLNTSGAAGEFLFHKELNGNAASPLCVRYRSIKQQKCYSDENVSRREWKAALNVCSLR